MRLPKGAQADGNITAPNITVSSATSELVNATSLKAYFSESKSILTDSVTITWNRATTNRSAQITLAGNRTLSITNSFDGDYGKLLVIQDATGNRTITLPAGSYVAGVGATTSAPIKLAANARSILSYWYDGTNYYWTAITF